MRIRARTSAFLLLAFSGVWSIGCGAGSQKEFQRNLDDVAKAAAKGKEQVKAEPRTKSNRAAAGKGKLADDDTF